jgi:hypothetical protein
VPSPRSPKPPRPTWGPALRRRWLVASIALALLVALTVPAWADDVPTFADRSDEGEQGGLRAVCVLFNPLGAALGVYGGEVDLAVGHFAAVAIEGGVYERTGGAATALGAGLLMYPLGAVFHRLYVEPRVVYARPTDDGVARLDWSADGLGLGATAGWQWTWDYGFSARLGGGGVYFVGGERPATGATLALGPELVVDGSIGWAF